MHCFEIFKRKERLARNEKRYLDNHVAGFAGRQQTWVEECCLQLLPMLMANPFSMDSFDRSLKVPARMKVEALPASTVIKL